LTPAAFDGPLQQPFAASEHRLRFAAAWARSARASSARRSARSRPADAAAPAPHRDRNRGIDSPAAFGQIDVVVNNGGVGVLGLQEAYTAGDMQRLFDIDLFGVQRVNRAVLPAMCRRGAGLLIHVSSLLGRITIPFYGPYNASKWALEAMAENYRTELSQFGVEVCLVEPGGYPTSFIDNLLEPSDTARAATCGYMQYAPAAALRNLEQALAANPPQNPQRVADALDDLIARPDGERPFRTTVDAMGMGVAVDGYDEKLAQVTEGIYAAFGMRALLKVKQA
jgi:NAD(P)-dependent dehydrogenase (short-subunit alcohol dehydrogenase family)